MSAAAGPPTGEQTTGPHVLPPQHSPQWRMMRARQILAAGYRHAVDYLEKVNDPRPHHTAAQAMWQEAISTTAAALCPANDLAPLRPLLGDEGD